MKLLKAESCLMSLLHAAAVILVAGGAVQQASAVVVPLVLQNVGTIGTSTVYRADLTGIPGLTQVGSIQVVDSGSGTGGSPGIFSGFDMDAIFLDGDGNLATTSDQIYASSFVFTAGTTRPTSDPTMQPNARHPGPTFGSLNATTIDYATATLNTFDGVAIADVNQASGFLTLGDGGTLTANFVPAVEIPLSLFLVTGEVGTQTGEAIGAFVTVSDVPEPSTFALTYLAGALLLLPFGLRGIRCLRNRKAAAY